MMREIIVREVLYRGKVAGKYVYGDIAQTICRVHAAIDPSWHRTGSMNA